MFEPGNWEKFKVGFEYFKSFFLQVIGVHTIAKMPVSIAEYLKLENPTSFTGHCFRRTSTTIFANAGEYKIMELKELGGSRLDNEATQ